MTLHRCQFCGKKGDRTAALARDHQIDHPWPAAYQLRTYPCASCGVPTHQQVSTFTSGNHPSWNGWSEMMMPDTDYEVVGRQYGSRRLDGRSAIVAAWVWHPMQADDASWRPRIVESIAQDEAFHTERARLLILPPGIDPAPWMPVVRDYFNECWQLKPHVMQGCVGPYPGLRAERSIVHTLSTLRLESVRHYWPSASLNQCDYCPMADSQTLRGAWAAYARSHIELKTKE